MENTNETAAICGLYCGTCSAYKKECDGCLSDRIAQECAICSEGFRECAIQHNILRCYECNEFPCIKLEQFSKKHVVNGVGHHTHVIDNLLYMKEFGVEKWINHQKEKHTCKSCGKLILWHEDKCPNCP